MNKVIKPRSGLEFIEVYDSPQPEAEIILNSNESPYNIPGELISKIEELVENFDFNRYPDPSQFKLKEKIASSSGVDEAMVALGNGGDELLLHTMLAYGGPERAILDFPPTFVVYKLGAAISGTKYKMITRDDQFLIDVNQVLQKTKDENIKIIFICNPNNPTGTLIPKEDIIKLLESTDSLVIVDEAYFHYSNISCQDLLSEQKNLAILRTFSKAFSFAGMRVGYLLACAEVVQNLERVRLPYNVNSFSQALAALVLDNRAFFKETVEKVINDREFLSSELKKTENVKVYPSYANYILFKVSDAQKTWNYLLDQGILVRIFKDDHLLQNCLRVTVGTPEENKMFLKGLREAVL